jgi:amino acid transporter
MSSQTAPAQAHDLRRVIGFFGGTALIVGITIGSGIFRTPPTIAGLVPNPLVIMGLWTLFGLISICGALVLAELSTMLPRAGGVYVFLREAYGDAAGFVFGWLYVLITTPTTVAALAVVFAEFLLNLLGKPVEARAVQLIAITAIVILTGANVLGARVGAAVSEVTTLVKVTALAAIILGAFLFGQGSVSHITEGGVVHGSGLARAVAAVIWTYDGWVAVSMIAGEVVAPERLMKRIIIVGMLVIVTLYIGANLAYLYMMPISVMAQQKEAIARTDNGDC